MSTILHNNLNKLYHGTAVLKSMQRRRGFYEKIALTDVLKTIEAFKDAVEAMDKENIEAILYAVSDDKTIKLNCAASGRDVMRIISSLISDLAASVAKNEGTTKAHEAEEILAHITAMVIKDLIDSGDIKISKEQ